MKYAIYAQSLASDWLGYGEEVAVATFSYSVGAEQYIKASKLKRYSNDRMSWYRAKSLLCGYVNVRVAPYVPKHPPHEPKL